MSNKNKALEFVEQKLHEEYWEQFPNNEEVDEEIISTWIYELMHEGFPAPELGTDYFRHCEMTTHVVKFEGRFIAYDYLHGGGKHFQCGGDSETMRFVESYETVVTQFREIKDESV